MATLLSVFAGVDKNGRTQLWATDGATATEIKSKVGLFGGLFDPISLFAGFFQIKSDILFMVDDTDLWVTDGSARGTREFKNTGFIQSNSGFVQLDGKVLFDGGEQLWITDGTARGTHVLPVNGASPSGLFSDAALPPDFTVLGNKVLFVGVDASFAEGFWVTDGTPAGTHELRLPDANTDSDPHFAAIGDKAVFVDSQESLGITDGTAQGTSALQISGESSEGLFGGGLFQGFTPGFTTFGSKVLLEGVDSVNETNAWLTDGTAAGTVELSPKGAGPGGLFNLSGSEINADFTAFGNKAVFQGVDSNGRVNLWITNGTPVGTVELTGIKNASLQGLFDGTLNPDFTVLGNEVLFAGRDSHSRVELWVTNGTSAGTTELIAPKGAFSGGLQPSDIAVSGATALFQGADRDGSFGLWVTDGTSAATHPVATTGASSQGLRPTDITPLLTDPPSGLALASLSDSGTKGDRITNVTKPAITGKGVAGDKVTLRDGTKVIGTATVAEGGTWSVMPAGALSAGVHTLTATETSSKFGVSAASAALVLTIKTSAPAPSELSFAVTADKGSAGDTFTVSGKGEAEDRVILFDGKTAIGSRKVGAGGAWTVVLNPLAVGAHSLSAGEVDVAGNTSAHSPAQRLTIAHAAPNAVTFFGSAGTDRFSGGTGNDVFRFSAADLGNTDIVKGGGGNDQLKLTSAGSIRANGVSGVETYVLFNGAGNVLSLTNANFAGVAGSTITVDGGTAGNTLSEAGVAATDKAALRGGAGNDILIAGRNAVLTGGSGKDVFELTVPGSLSAPVSITITDFAHGTDKIAFREKRFDLGSAPAAATLFGANATGSFGTAAQRFAYDTTDGALFFDAHGSAAHSSQELIATLTHSPTLTAGDISFLA